MCYVINVLVDVINVLLMSYVFSVVKSQTCPWLLCGTPQGWRVSSQDLLLEKRFLMIPCLAKVGGGERGKDSCIEILKSFIYIWMKSPKQKVVNTCKHSFFHGVDEGVDNQYIYIYMKSEQRDSQRGGDRWTK